MAECILCSTRDAVCPPTCKRYVRITLVVYQEELGAIFVACLHWLDRFGVLPGFPDHVHGRLVFDLHLVLSTKRSIGGHGTHQCADRSQYVF